jgi:uncharacterized RDD family membrane protein YckC
MDTPDGTPRRFLEIATPEGVALPFEVAPVGDRAAALLLDLVIIHVAVAVMLVVGALLGAAGFGHFGLSLALLSSFLLRNFYFAFFEIRWGGATPGKRKYGLRAIARDGGPLSAESVLVRNLTREFEIFLPVTALAAPQALLPGTPAWAALIGCVWLLVGGLLPLFNRDHLRLGDLLGGTVVVMVPRAKLLAELAEEPVASTAAAEGAARPAPEFVFTLEQLDLYGIEELQVLEELLRHENKPGEAQVLEAVALKIREKIGWAGESGDTREFLRAFYRQQRARLEHKALFGVRQQKKKAGRLGRG